MPCAPACESFLRTAREETPSCVDLLRILFCARRETRLLHSCFALVVASSTD
jgi:hypothetical protein